MLNTAVENDEGVIKDGITVGMSVETLLQSVAPWEQYSVFLDRDYRQFVVLWTEFEGWSWDVWYQS